jgi:hypothetical protein
MILISPDPKIFSHRELGHKIDRKRCLDFSGFGLNRRSKARTAYTPRVFLALLFLLFGQNPTNGAAIDYSTARFERRLQPAKVSEAINIDGRIDEEACLRANVRKSAFYTPG